MALIFATACVSACGADSVGTMREGGEFAGDEESSNDNGTETPVSGESSCSLLDPSTCADGYACTPTSRGVRACVENAVLPMGAACDANDQRRCVAGALCYNARAKGAYCVEVCDPRGPQCASGQCNYWFEIDGEAVGWCGDP